MAESKKDKLEVERVLRDFENDERSQRPRRGTFKIESPFDQAVKKILKAKPEPKEAKKRARKNDD